MIGKETAESGAETVSLSRLAHRAGEAGVAGGRPALTLGILQVFGCHIHVVGTLADVVRVPCQVYP